VSTRESWAARLDRFLFPVMGPAQLGPGSAGERPAAPRAETCPLCGAPMSEHRIERDPTGHVATRLHCP